MKSIILAVLGICFGAIATLWALAGKEPASAPPASIVIRVVDGSTLRLLDGRTVRLAHAQAPALDQPGGLAAVQALQSIILDRRVVLINPVRVHGDTWSATVLIDGHRDAGHLMLKRGYAWHVDIDAQPTPERELYGFQQAEARHDRRGLWRDRRPVPPWEWPSLSCGDPQSPEPIVIRTIAV